MIWLLGILMLFFTQRGASFEENTMVRLHQEVVRHAALPDCWICSFFPSHGRLGLPSWPVPLELSDWYNKSIDAIEVGLSDVPPFTLRGPQRPAAICFNKTISHKPLLGVWANCSLTFYWDGMTWMLEGASVPFLNHSHNSTKYTLYTLFLQHPARSRAPKPLIINALHALQHPTPLRLDSGFWWFCGLKALKVLPPDWEGTCTIGWLWPGGMHPRAVSEINYSSRSIHRSPRSLSKPWKWSVGTLLGRAFLPSVGVAENYKDIYLLADFVYNTSVALETLENITADVQTRLQNEIISVKNMVLQHRLALDMVLLQQGGICAYINETCCIFHDEQQGLILDHDNLSALIRKHQSDRTRTYTALNAENWENWDWSKLTSWLPDFSTLKSTILGIVLLIGVALFIGILTKLIAMATALCPSIPRTRTRSRSLQRESLNSAILLLSEFKKGGVLVDRQT